MITEFPLLESFVGEIELINADAELVKEIQSLLNLEVDGRVGPQTLSAFAEFKKDQYLEHPTILGASTAKAIAEIAVGHAVTEQTGQTMQLPNGETVSEHQLIVPGIPLTWGEMTKGCDKERTPVSNQIIVNIRKVAVAFGKLRDKYGKPITITSGYRPPKVNSRIGGASRSQHIQGLAIDVCPMDKGDLIQVYEIMLTIPEFTAIGRGMKRGFVHGDCRAGGRILFNY